MIKPLILALLCLLQAGAAFADDDYSRVIKKEFDVNPDANLVLNNKYGKIHCNNWEKNTIQIEVTVTVTAGKQETADKIMNGISVVFNANPSQVEAKTVIDEIKARGRRYFQIDYMIHLPSTINLDITNKFGDIYLNEVTGKCKINLSYGNLDANKLGHGDNLLDLKFSNADVNWMKGAVVLLKYSNFDLDYAGSLRLDSKFSNLKADKIIALNVSFEGGRLDMEANEVMDCRSKFSDIDVQRLEQSLSLDIQYGSCDIHEVAPGFSAITVRNKYGDVNVEIPEGAAYTLDAQLKFCELEFPERNSKFSYRSQTSTEKVYKGTVNGGDETPKAKVTITSEFGNVSLD